MRAAPQKIKKVLVIDVGGTHVKVMVSGQSEERRIPSGSKMTAAEMVRDVKRLARNWQYDCVSIGYPGLVIHGQPVHEPHNLGAGWVGFNFGKAFDRPVKVINDAAMQALGSYQGGRMLFLGLGAGLGRQWSLTGYWRRWSWLIFLTSTGRHLRTTLVFAA